MASNKLSNRTLNDFRSKKLLSKVLSESKVSLRKSINKINFGIRLGKLG